MRHASWTAIESSPLAMGLYRAYRRLPERVRAPARWLAMPRWQLACRIVRTAAGNRVLSGPFAGMQLNLAPVSSRNLLSYLLGTQELELADVIERIIARAYPSIINIGVADGYYAIGLALRISTTRVVGFEALPEHHAPVMRAAQANGVAERIRVDGLCTPAELVRELKLTTPPTLVLADIEGGEIELLDPAVVEALAGVDALVETHDGLRPGCTRTLIERFAETHDIERITARPRTFADFPRERLPLLARLIPETAVELMNERRTGVQEWLYMTAKPEPQRRHV